jgi:CheY-like chemotaxis protein
MSQQVLIVEDDPSLAYVLSLLLERENTEFVVVASVPGAISPTELQERVHQLLAETT